MKLCVVLSVVVVVVSQFSSNRAILNCPHIVSGEFTGVSLESLKSQFIFISTTFSLAFATERLSVLFVKIQKHLKHLRIFTWDGQPGLVLVANGVGWMT